MGLGVEVSKRRYEVKTLHKLVTLLVVVVLLLPVAACGPAQEGGGGGEDVTIGAIFPLTGASTHEGIDERRGVELAMEQINADGGIDGRNLKVIFEDSESRPEAGTDAAHKLIDVNNVPAIIGVFSSGVTLPAAAYAQEQGVVMVNPGSTSPKCAEVGDYFFSTIGLDHLMGSEQAKLALEEGYGKVAVLVPNNPFGIGMEEWMVKTFEEAGAEVTSIIEYPLEQTDYRAELQRLFEGDPEAILYTAYGEESKILTRQAMEMGHEAQWIGGYLTMCTGVADPEAVEGHIGLEPSYHLPAGQDFEEAFVEKFGEEPAGPFSYLAYDAAWLIALAMREGGTDADSIRDALPSVAESYDAASGEIRFDENGQRASQPYDRLIYTDGSVELYNQ
jgi:branched-chain amino acid transport system substrate-binding protein